jgi:hypothetical protein
MQSSQLNIILGEYPAKIYFQVASITTIFTLIIIYWISQYLHHDKPFSYSWISDVAAHYPEFIFFRTATISGSVLLVLGWFTNHFYLQTIVRKKLSIFINSNHHYVSFRDDGRFLPHGKHSQY